MNSGPDISIEFSACNSPVVVTTMSKVPLLASTKRFSIPFFLEILPITISAIINITKAPAAIINVFFIR